MIRSLVEGEGAPESGQLQVDHGGSKSNIALVALAVIATLAVSALLIVFLYYCHIRRKVKKQSQSQRFKSKNVQLLDSTTVSAISLQQTEAQVFTFKQLQAATSNFNKVNVVGHGGFGSVYRGVLADGRRAAIKQLDRSSKQGDHEFHIEVDMLSRLHSPYLVGLLGYCANQDHRLLVYEYMPNGNLQEHLYSDGIAT